MSVKGMILKFQPKGSMCAVCADKHKDCSGINFYKMPVIDTDRNEEHTVMIVACKYFKRLQ